MTAWLIERADLAQPQYFTIRDGEMAYTADPGRAMRFSRGQDAAALLTYIFFTDATVKLTERVFAQHRLPWPGREREA